MNEDKAREAFETPAKTVQRWMSMIDYAYQCRDDIRSSSGETPRSGELRLLAEEMRAALQWAASQPQDAKAWAVLGEDGDVSMVFIDRDEALTYCGEGEQPMPLVFGGAASQQAAEGPAAASIPEFGSKMFTGNNRAFLETFTVHVDPDLPPNEVQFRYIDRVVCRLLLDGAAPSSTQGGADEQR